MNSSESRGKKLSVPGIETSIKHIEAEQHKLNFFASLHHWKKLNEKKKIFVLTLIRHKHRSAIKIRLRGGKYLQDRTTPVSLKLPFYGALNRSM